MPVNLVHGAHGLPRVVLTEPRGSSAEVLLYGGQVVSWKNERREELLFMSSKGTPRRPKAIRGGIAVCFPQFGHFASFEQHGFARNRLWSLDSCPSSLPLANDQTTIDLVLKPMEDDLKLWPHCFELRLRVSLSPGKLTLIPRFVCSEVRVEGLETLDYFDNLALRQRFTEQADSLTFDGEVDRVYLNTPSKIVIIDHEKKRTFVLRKGGLPEAAVWNPWDKKSKSIEDFRDDDYKTMLCIEPGAHETPIVLKPFEEWKGYQELSTVSSSYCSGQLDPLKVLHSFS